MARRSASLVAAALAGLLRQMDRDGLAAPMQRTTIVIDGGLFEHYMAYRGYVREYLDLLLGPEVRRMPLHHIQSPTLIASMCNAVHLGTPKIKTSKEYFPSYMASVARLSLSRTMLALLELQYHVRHCSGRNMSNWQ